MTQKGLIGNLEGKFAHWRNDKRKIKAAI